MLRGVNIYHVYLQCVKNVQEKQSNATEEKTQSTVSNFMINLLNANPEKWSNTLKQIDDLFECV